MPIQQYFKCDQCGMKFPTDEALFKHKTRFCIGVKDSGIGRKFIYSDDEGTDITTNKNYTIQSAGTSVLQHKSSVEKKREEIDEWKRQRAILQRVEDMENRILHDRLKTQKIANYIKQQDNIYNEIYHEYERLRVKEQDLLRHLYILQTKQSSINDFNTKGKQTNDSIDIPIYQFEELQRRNHRLEKERRIIQKKLEELIATNNQSSIMSNYDPYKFLREMKEQQQLNEKALEFLRGRFAASKGSASNINEVPFLPYINTGSTRSRPTDSDYIRNFRQGYLYSGGHDARVLSRYGELEHKLRSDEGNPWLKGQPEPLRQARYQSTDHLSTESKEFQIANEENSRLKNELHDMYRKFSALDKRTRQLELTMGSNSTTNVNNYQRPYQSQMDVYSKSYSLPYENKTDQKYQPKPAFYSQSELPVRDNHNDQRRIYHQTSLPYSDKRLTPRQSPAINLLDSNMYRLHDTLAPQSYDPTGGFIIFFDFIINMPSTVQQCRLVTSLHHPKSGLGEPSLLEPVKCNQFVDERTGENMRIALIATKQPVLRCPPHQALTVIIEVQTSTDKQAPREQLQTSALAKLALFDDKNRLASGRWKVPLKLPSFNISESLAVIGLRPSYENAELYYRLVNSQDGDEQANTPLTPNLRNLYAYPLQVSLLTII
ncbi:unnamed protein product [Adineta steineri]|uniref:C2H2-type domain-containing protein n=2 Tax=Adineta steineri TaxID=433720 RepID=A0A819CYL0_9BILA|nr:unnamed protein product [Adineta steineri]